MSHQAPSTTTSASAPVDTAQALPQAYLDTLPPDKNHQIVAATVLDVNDEYVLLDLGIKTDGVLPVSELKDQAQLAPGTVVEVYVEAQENALGAQVISHKKARLVKTWQRIEKAFADEEPLEATVLRNTKGGLVVDIDGVEAFCPGSQIDLSPVKDYHAWVDQKIEVLVIKMHPAKANIVVSRKALLKKSLESQKREILSNLQVGQILEGTVKNITHFGVFVDLGSAQSGIVGLVYVKNMVWDKRVDHPDKALDPEGNRLFEVGKQVKVVVLDFDQEKNHVSLATRNLFPNPWEQLPDTFQVGATLQGTVVKVLDTGAILEVSPGIEAYLHVSEMSHSTYVQKPADLVTPGQQLEVAILSLDPEAQELRVGLKQLIPDPWEEEAFHTQYALDTRHKGVVRRITSEGAYLEIAPGVQGYLGLKHLSWVKRYNHPREVLKQGATYHVVVLNIDTPGRLLQLGLRECEDSPWGKFKELFRVGSTHQGTVIKKIAHGAIVKLPHELETFVTAKALVTQDKKPVQEGQVLDFLVTDCNKSEESVMVSHTATYEPSARHSQEAQGSTHAFAPAEKAVMGNLDGLSALKAQLQEQEQAIKKASEDTEAPAP